MQFSQEQCQSLMTKSLNVTLTIIVYTFRGLNFPRFTITRIIMRAITRIIYWLYMYTAICYASYYRPLEYCIKESLTFKDLYGNQINSLHVTPLEVEIIR